MAFADDTTGGRVIEETFGGPIKITLAGSASVGDLLGYSSGWKQADGDNSIYAELVAGEEGVTDDVITAWRGAKISGVTGGTAGNPVYLSDTAGGYSGSSGTVTQMVGLMSDATTMFVQPEYYGSESIFIDEMELAFGTGRDVTIEWDGTNFIVTAAADDSLIEIGDSAATQKSFDVKWYGNAANGADYLYLDRSSC